MSKMRIFIPTSNAYIWACETSCRLLAKYWPNHPGVDICHFERRPVVPKCEDFLLHDLGKQAECQKWVDQFIRFLGASREELVLLMLDDYGLCRQPNTEAISRAEVLLAHDPMICSVALTWQPTRKEPYPHDRDFVLFPKWDWTINTQAGLWRRADLLTICQLGADLCGASPWKTEQALSHRFHELLWPKGYRIAGWNCPEPSNPSGFVDSVDKTGWPLAYHNLYHSGQRDQRHEAFLRAEGLL